MKGWIICVGLLMPFGCRMPAPVPMPKRDAELRAEAVPEGQYVSALMFELGRISALQQEGQRFTDELSGQDVTSDNEKREAVKSVVAWTRRAAHQLQDIIKAIGKLKAPAKYAEFQQVLMEGQTRIAETSLLAADAMEAGNQERLMEMLKRTDEAEANARDNLEKVVRSSGAKSLNEFLGVKE